MLLGTTTQPIGLGFSFAVGLAATAGKEQMTVLVNGAAYGAEFHQYTTKGISAAPMLIPELDFAPLIEHTRRTRHCYSCFGRLS